MYRFGVVSLFPELVAPVMEFGVVGRAARARADRSRAGRARGSSRPIGIARSTIDRTAAGRAWC